MKTIDKLTEEQILALSEQEIEQMIKFKMASEGIKIMEQPRRPELHVIPEHDKVVYKCGLFGAYLTFEDVDELRTIIAWVKGSKSAVSISSDYSSTKDTNHILSKFNTVGYTSREWDVIETQKVYSNKLYGEIQSMVEQNKKINEKYDKVLEEYTKSQEGVTDIQNEIWDRVREVKEKYYNLKLHTQRFGVDYMPLAENNEKVAMKFLRKAYDIDDEAEAYILSHYNKKEA